MTSDTFGCPLVHFVPLSVAFGQGGGSGTEVLGSLVSWAGTFPSRMVLSKSASCGEGVGEGKWTDAAPDGM